MTKCHLAITCMLIVLMPLSGWGQIALKENEKTYGQGELCLKKTIDISFYFSEKHHAYRAKASYNFDKLVIGKEKPEWNGLIQVPLNEFQDVKLKKARYYKLDSANEKVLIENVKVKYADIKDYYINNIFYSDLKVKQFKCSLPLPENYLLSYSYDIIYNDLKFLNTIFIQNENEAVVDFEVSIKKNDAVKVSIEEFNFSEHIERIEDEVAVRYRAKKLSRFSSGPASVGGSYYLPHLILSVRSIKIANQEKTILNSTNDLYTWYHSLINELSPQQEYLQKLNESILGPNLGNEEKIERIFKWVQENIQYVAFEDGIAGFKPEESHEVAQSKYGDCKGIAHLLVSMLREEGFDSHHAWIGTRAKKYSYQTPSLVVDNHMICALNYDNKMYFLDGTSKTALWQKAPSHLMGKEVMIETQETYKIDTIPVTASNESLISIRGIAESNTQKIIWKGSLSGYFAQEYLSIVKYAPAKKKDFSLYYFMSNYLEDMLIENFKAQVFEDSTITFSMESELSVIQNETITIFPFIDFMTETKLEEMGAPSYINFPYEIDVKLELRGINQSKDINFEKTFGNEKYSAKISSINNQNRQVINQNLSINILNTSTEKQKDWNEFIKQVDSFSNYPLSFDKP